MFIRQSFTFVRRTRQTKFELSVPIFWLLYTFYKKPEQRSRYSDWLQAGRPRGQRSSPDRVKNFLHLVQAGSGPTQPIQWVPRALSPG
jgi:hypothetical protein